MARNQTLVQLTDELRALLDQRAVATGISRSELIREAISVFLQDDIQGAIDVAIEAGYDRIPADQPGPLELALAISSIDEEPW